MLALCYTIGRTILSAVSSSTRQQQTGSALTDARSSAEKSGSRPASPTPSDSLSAAKTTSRPASPPPFDRSRSLSPTPSGPRPASPTSPVHRSASPPPFDRSRSLSPTPSDSLSAAKKIPRRSHSAPPVLSRSSKYLEKKAFDELLVKLNSPETILEALATINRKDLTFTTSQQKELTSKLNKLYSLLETKRKDLRLELAGLKEKHQLTSSSSAKNLVVLEETNRRYSKLKEQLNRLAVANLTQDQINQRNNLSGDALVTYGIHRIQQQAQVDIASEGNRLRDDMTRINKKIQTIKDAKTLIETINKSPHSTLDEQQSYQIVTKKINSLTKDLNKTKPPYEQIISELEELKAEFYSEFKYNPVFNEIFVNFSNKLNTKLMNSQTTLNNKIKGIENKKLRLPGLNFTLDASTRRQNSSNPKVEAQATLEYDIMEEVGEHLDNLNSELAELNQQKKYLTTYQKEVTQLIDSTQLKRSSSVVENSSVRSFRSPSPSLSPFPLSRSSSTSSVTSSTSSVTTSPPVLLYSTEVNSLLEAINAKLDNVGILNQIVNIFTSEPQNKDILEQYCQMSVDDRKQVLDAIKRKLDDITSSDLDSSARATELEALLEYFKKHQTPSLSQIYGLIATNTPSWSWVLPKSKLNDNEIKQLLPTFRSESREAQIKTLNHLLEHSETRQIAVQILNNLTPSIISNICIGLDPDKDSPELILEVAKHFPKDFEKTEATLNLQKTEKLLKIVEHLIEKKVDIETFQPLADKYQQKLKELYKSQQPFIYVNRVDKDGQAPRSAGG